VLTSSRLLLTLAAVSVTVFLFTHVSHVRAAETSLTSDQAQVVETVRAIFAAAHGDDFAKFHSVTTPDFYLFDGGIRFDGESIMQLTKQKHAEGKRYEWNVTEPDVHIYGSSAGDKTAWVAYVNQGSLSDSSGTVPKKWLESAFLQKKAEGWKIVFMHSTPVVSTAPVGQPEPGHNQ
jgi:ketosteroid isomerase-like protein